MRIRKNRRLCHELDLGDDNIEPHCCQLNQSPWDAIPFCQESVYQFERQHSFDGNGTFNDSVPAADRDTEAPAKKTRVDVVYKEEKVLTENQEAKINENDDMVRTWNCKKENLEADSMCDHDFVYLKSCIRNSNSIDSGCDIGLIKTPIKKIERAAKRGRYLSLKRQEFYYYSGFGPLWGKKRDTLIGATAISISPTTS